MSDSPVVILFDINGNEVSTTDGYAVSGSTPGLIIAGTDGSNAYLIKTDATGRLLTVSDPQGTAGTPAGGVLSVQGVVGGQALPINGSVTANIGTTNGLALDTNLVKLTIAPGTALGSNTLSMIGGSVTTSAPSYSNGSINPISLNTAGAIRVDGSGVTQPVSGTVNVQQTTAANLNATVVQGNAGSAAQSWFTKISDGTDTVGISTVGGAKALKVDIVQTVGGSSSTADGYVTTAAPSYTNNTARALSLTTAGALRVDGSAVTQPISGTITANAGTGTFTVSGTVAATQSGTWNVNNISGTVSLPTGAATETTLATLLTSSTFTGRINTLGQKTMANSTPVVLSSDQSAIPITDNSGSITVDGTIAATQSGTWNITNISGTVSLPTGAATESSLVKLTLAQGSSTSGQTGVLNLAAVTTSAPSYTNGQSSPLSLDTTGALRVNVTAGGANASVSSTGSAPPASATYIGGSVTTAAPSYTNGQMSGLSLTTSGQLRVDGSGVTQPVSGTITANAGTGNFTVVQASAANLNATVTGTVAATQSGTWTVQPGNTANTTPWLTSISQGGNTATVTGSNALKVDGSAVTQPISAASLPLPTGAATESSLAKLTVAQGAALGTNTQALVGGSVTTSAPTYTNGQISPLSLDTTGALRVATSATADGYQSGTLGALNNTVTIDLTGKKSAGVMFNYGTLNGTITYEFTLDGTTWLTDPDIGYPSIPVNNLNTLIYDQFNIFGGLKAVRVRVSSYTSGSASAALATSEAPDIGTTNSWFSYWNETGVPLGNGGNKVGVTNVGGQYALKVDVVQSVGGGSGGTADGYATTSAPTYSNNTSNPLSLTTTGLLRVDGSAVTQPVSGTVTVSGTVAATQSGTWTMQPGNTANTTPWLITLSQGGNAATVTASNALKVDGSAVTQPVSGTITANAGTGNFTVVQSTASNLRSQTASEGSTGSSPPSVAGLTGGSVTTAAPSYTNGQMSALSLTTTGLLRVDGSGVTQPVSGTITANAGTGSFTVVQSTAANLRAQTASEGSTGSSPPAIAGLTGGSVTTAAPSYTNGQMSALSLTTAGLLRVDASGTTQSISGTVTANAGTGNFTVTQATASNLRAQTAAESATGSAPPSLAVLTGGSVTTAAPVYTNGQMSALSLNTSGQLRVEAAGSNTATPTLANVSGSASSVTLIASNTARKGATIYNDSTVNLYVKFGSAASTTSFTVLMLPGGYYEVPFSYTGIITGIWDSATGAARTTELTA